MTLAALWVLALVGTTPPAQDAAHGYFVRIAASVDDDRVAATAHDLSRRYAGKLRLINLRASRWSCPGSPCGH